MRRLACLFVLCAACSSDEGAVLTFEAPDGLSATRIEVVLASADPAKISTIDNQRVRAGDTLEDAVVYYRQRARGGVVEPVGRLAGFVLTIEPELTAAPDETFIPFVLAYDGDALIAVGTVADVDGAPRAVKIVPDALVTYTLAVQPVTPPSDPDAALAVDEGHEVSCVDKRQTTWRSGVAWQPPTGHQLRLLLPDLGTDAAATDASAREPDLDCDAHAAWSGDCDDLRLAFHPGAQEVCDGLDFDCDKRRVEVLEGCTISNGTTCTTAGGTTTTTGVQLCLDAGLQPTTSTCAASAACCPDGAAGCVRCTFDYTAPTAGAKLLCAPSVGKVHVSAIVCDTCTLEVVSVKGPWKVTLGKAEVGPFSREIIGVPGNYYVRAEPTQTGPITTPLGSSLSEAYLLLTRGTNTPELMSVDLFLPADGPSSECTAVLNSTDKAMICTL